MARIEPIKFSSHSAVIGADGVVWQAEKPGRKVDLLPQIFWADNTPWREANLWAHERAIEDHKEPRTVLAEITALTSYAKWLEANDTDWSHFPERKKNRCLVRYRGHLIESRNKSELAPSTASERMRVVISFYRWAKANEILSVSGPLWRDKTIRFVRPDSFGMDRTFAVLTSELAIPNRITPHAAPEGSLMPVSSVDRNAFLDFVRESASEEIFLLLSLGFFTGMRLGSLVDLKIKTLENALPDPRCGDLFRLTLGPGARPQVATKFGITGQIYIPRTLLEYVKEYAVGTRRLLREAKAKPEHKELVFLTRFGNPYAQRGSNKSVAVNVEMHALRKKAVAAGIAMADGFWFHQTRATFGTELARIALKYCSAPEAISIVREALLQRSEGAALHYIRFVEKTPVKIEMANEFTRSFLGVFSDKE
jgi:integrase